MKERVHALLGSETTVQLGTFHWICNAILRRHIHHLGYPRDFRLLGPAESRHLLRQSALEVTTQALPAHGAMAAAISAVKNGSPLALAARQHSVDQGVLVALQDLYGRRLRSIQALDLDDLLALTVQLLRDHTSVQQRCREAHDEVLVDEYQDINPVQHELLRLLAPLSGSLVAVGDEDQAIYGWRQADARNMLWFTRDFPGARIVKLEETYRSTKHILRAATSLIEHNTARRYKALRTPNPAGERPSCFVAGDEVEEAEWIVGEIARLCAQESYSWTDFAVLYRINAQSRAIEDALVRRGVPYHIHAGRRFYDRPEIRRVVAYLRLALDRGDDQAAEYLLESVPGIGPRRLSALRDSADVPGLHLLDRLAAPSITSAVPTPLRARLEEVRRAMEGVYGLRHSSLDRVLNAAIEAAEDGQYASSLEQEAARENLAELRSVMRALDARETNLRLLVDRLSQGGERTATEPGVSLMSLHAAKGLEFAVVFLAGLEEGLLPYRRALEDDDALEEERRLCYVGMTRAAQRLYLSYAHGRLLGGQALIGHPSRFLGEAGRNNFTFHLSRRASAKPRLQQVEPGERVMHPRWHAGTVLAVEGSGRETLVTIAFDRMGRQRLQLCHAPLIRLPEGNVLAGHAPPRRRRTAYSEETEGANDVLAG
jgi:DNA helicase-2/ATP-dependent DNA helicase PcrA